MAFERSIAVIGEALVDIVPDEHGHSRAVPGGSGLNTALALARLDVPTYFCGSLSRDSNGRALTDFLSREGIALDCARSSALPCPHVNVTAGRDGAPHYDLHLAGSALDDAPSIWPLPGNVLHLHATSFASTAGAQGVAALAAMGAMRGTASTSFDPNIRAAALPERRAWPALLAARIAQADIVKASAEDLDLLTQGGDRDALLRDWRDLGAKLIIVTKGADGASALFGNSEISVASPSVAVRDTVGAGDTFMGALLAAMREEAALGAQFRLPDAQSLERWLHFAAHAAALCCTRPGADPPRRAAL